MFQPSQPDLLTLWSTRLAQRVAPEEIDIAADLAVAYAAGGAERRTLFLQPRTDPGSFGTGLGLFLPHLWQALDTAYTVLRAVLGDPSVANIVAIAGLVLSYRQSRKGNRQASTVRPTGSAADSIDVAIDQVRSGLERAGLSPEEAEQKAIDTIEELLRDPASAASFLDQLRRNRP